MKIYTKTGDQGTTALFGGRRLPKSHLRIDAYGTVDELNSHIGLLSDQVEQTEVINLLRIIQHTLFNIGSQLASDPAKEKMVPDIPEERITELEQAMDKMNEDLPALKNFILPGGHPTVSVCHITRCVCRRAERLVVALHLIDPVDELILQYLNRLSDYFFVLARWLGQDLGAEEVIWES